MMVFSSIIVLLFFSMDPIGNIPLFVDALKNVEKEKRLLLVCRELLIALGILMLFLFCGRFIMDHLHIDQSALHVAGGIVLFLIAVKMIFPMEAVKRESDETQTAQPFIVPLAVPLIAGPSTITMLIIFSTKESLPVLALALSLAWFLSALVLLTAILIHKMLSKAVLIAMERLMGMILIVIAVQMTMDGWAMRFH